MGNFIPGPWEQGHRAHQSPADDASALIAFLQKTPSAYRVNELLKEAQQERVKVLMSAVNYGEVKGKFCANTAPTEHLQLCQR
ncbi:MAG TPA: hypothetical protein VIH78_09600 [Terriglobales bacterium]